MSGGSITISKVITGEVKTPVYGCLYPWATVADERGIAPDDWHVPSVAEWDILFTELGGTSVAGYKLSETGTTHWDGPHTLATNISGFTARGSGYRSNTGESVFLKSVVDFWCSTSVWKRINWEGVISSFSIGANYGATIRLVKNDSTDPGTMTDFDGNVYPTVKIGNQVWMAASLIVEHFNNGDPIPYIGGGTAWASLTGPGMCYYNNATANAYTTAVGGVIDDDTEFTVTVTGQKVNPVISEKQVSQAAPVVFSRLPYDTYTITEDTIAGYTLDSIVPDEITLGENSQSDTAEITNTCNFIDPSLNLTFDNIANVPVNDASSVSDWNTFFDLPANGVAFTSVEVAGNVVTLIGGWGITLKINIFLHNPYILSFEDISGCVTYANSGCFFDCSSITIIYLPELLVAGATCFRDCELAIISCPKITSAGQACFSGTKMNICYFPALTAISVSCFQDCADTTVFDLPSATSVATFAFLRCTAVTTINLPAITSLGSDVYDSSVFYGISGQTITLTVPASLMTCNGGDPDGDIQYLQANNTVTVITV